MSHASNGYVAALKRGFHGQILVDEDPEFELARRVWNGMIDRRPTVIARCADPVDVARAVRTARDEGLTLAVRGGGHNSAGNGVSDGGVTIDLSLLRRVVAENGTVRAEGGALLADLDEETQRRGTAVPAGIISHTGIGGLSLGGGFGWISRQHGLSVDNLVSAEVITASGDEARADEKENPDLFWALRGGGGNFGIVTSFKFRSVKIGAELLSGLIVKRFEDAGEYLRFHRSYVRTLPDGMTIYVVVRHAPPLPFIPAETHGRMILALAFAWLGDRAEGERLLQPVRDTGHTVAEMSGMNRWVDWQKGFDGLVPHGARNYWKSHDLPELSNRAIDAILDHCGRMPTSDTQIVIPHLEGAIGRVAAGETAYEHRRVPFLLNIETRWIDPEDDARCLAWTKEFHDATRDFAQGVYVNFLGDEGEERVRQAYSPEAWERLVEIKRRWDPENLFRMNQNIRP